MLIGFRNLISPRICLFCGSGDEYICSECFALNLLSPELTYLHNIPTISMSRYKDLVREIIIRHKDHHFVAVRKYLAKSLSLGIKILNLPRDCTVISIPTSISQITKRLDDPVRYLVSDAAALGNLRYDHRVLTLKAFKKDQVGLNFWQRERNVSEIFSIARVTNKVVVCDDVITSGATLRAANLELTKAGIQVLANICVANTPKTMRD